MNQFYKDRYDKFINYFTNLNQNKDLGYELHHIIPRSMGGSDDESNLVILSPRAHYIAHVLLHKAYGGSMTYALWAMCHMNNEYQDRNYKINSKVYQNLRLEYAEMCSKKFSGEGNPMYGISLPGRKGKDHPNYGKKISEETRAKLIASSPHRNLTNEEKEHLSNLRKGENNPFYGKTHSEEWKERERELKNRPEVKQFCREHGKRVFSNPKVRNLRIKNTKIKAWDFNPSIWILAQKYYEIWKSNNFPTAAKFKKIANTTDKIEYLLTLFKGNSQCKDRDPWIPNQDPLWIEWSSNYKPQ